MTTHHMLVAHNPDTGLMAKLLLQMEDGEDGPVPDQAVAQWVAKTAPLLGPGTLRGWSATWDHEPTEAEQDEHLPEGLRSTDEGEPEAAATLERGDDGDLHEVTDDQ